MCPCTCLRPTTQDAATCGRRAPSSFSRRPQAGRARPDRRSGARGIRVSHRPKPKKVGPMSERKTVPTKPRLGLSAWLTLLVVGAMLPLLVFSGLTLRGLLDSARALADRGQGDTARALALAVDGEVRSWKAAATALAESRS